VNHAQDLNLSPRKPIRDDERKSADDKFARILDPALAAQARITLKLPHIAPNFG